MRVVAIDAPSLQSALHNEVMARTAHVVHDLFATIFLIGLPDARAESLQHFIPRSPSPFPSAPRPRTLHRIKDAVGVMNLRDRCRTLGAKASAACGVFGIAFKLRDLSGLFVDISEKSASRFAIEADGRNKLIMPFNATWPGFGIILNPIVPLLNRRVRREMAALPLEIGHCCISILFSNLAVRHALAGHHEAPFKNQKSTQSENTRHASGDAMRSA